MFPQAPAWERAVSWVCLMVHTLNCWIGRQKSSDPHVAIEVGSHSAVSVYSHMNSLMSTVICNYREGTNYLDGGSPQIPGGDAG